MEPWVLEVSKRAETGKPPVRGGRSDKLNKITFDDLVFIPSGLDKPAVDYFKTKINSETILGKSSKHPLKLSMPILIGAMSFGALGKPAKLALAKAASAVGTAVNTGEGGALPEERKRAKILIVQYSTGRFGITENILRNADAVEIKIGQGAKPGQGGLLPADKVTKEIAEIRNVPFGQDVHSPPSHPDIQNLEDLKKKVSWLKKVINGKPIIIKFGAGDVESQAELAVKAGADVVAFDGIAGGTGAAPEIMLNDFGIPTLSAVVRARKTLDKLKSKIELIIGGGLNTGADVAKALALGADAVFLGFPMLVSMGCIYCKQCHLGKCPFGITTQDPELQKKFNPKAAEKAANYLKALNEEVKMAAGATGNNDVHGLDRKDLRSLSLLTEKITGVPLV